MTTYRRATSPNGSRIYLETPRASTGTVSTSSYDTRYDQRAPRASFSVAPASSQSSGSRHSSIYETQPLSKRVYNDAANPGATISRTEYAVRPRRNSGTVESRRPLSLMTNKLGATGDFLESPRDIVPYKPQAPPRQTDRLLAPTYASKSAHHQRHNSATRAETGRSFTTPTAPRVERGYHSRGPYVEKVSSSRPSAAPVRYEEPTYEYTNPREQFDRDFPGPTLSVAPIAGNSKPRADAWNGRERPASATAPRFESAPFRRDQAPPSAVRQLRKLERDERKSGSGFESDPDRPSDRQRAPRASYHRHGPVVHQNDDDFASNREDQESRKALVQQPRMIESSVIGSRPRYRDSLPELDRESTRYSERDRDRARQAFDRDNDKYTARDREPPRDHDRSRHERRPSITRSRNNNRDRDAPRAYESDINDEEASRRSRRHNERFKDDSPEHSGLKTVATAALGGLVSAGVLGHKSRKDGDASESDEKRERRRRSSREPGADRATEGEERHRRRRSHSGRQPTRQESSGSDTPEESSRRERPRSRTRQRASTIDGYSSEPDRAATSMAGSDGERHKPSRSDGSAQDPVGPRSLQSSPLDPQARTMSPGEDEDGRPRRVSIVEPNKDLRLALKPKGILKPPRAVPFPEDPNPTREGVAPLKQAGKDGIPNGARWTKISRILVNPEALERYQERFEERDDYVIVLRVVSREEIEKLAEKTREIREQREREWQKQVDERKQRRVERGERGSDSGDADEEINSKEQQLAIEPAGAPAPDLRQLIGQSNAQQQQSQVASIPNQGYAPQQMALPRQEHSQTNPLHQAQPDEQYSANQFSSSHQVQQQPQAAPQDQFPQYQQQQQHQSQWQQKYTPQDSANNLQPGQTQSARSSAERLSTTVPAQLVSAHPEVAHPTAENTYSQNV